MDFGSAGHGTSTGLALELFRIMARVKITHVPYKGIGQALVDVLAGQVHGLFGTAVEPHLCEGGQAGARGHGRRALCGAAGAANRVGIRGARLRIGHLARLARPPPRLRRSQPAQCRAREDRAGIGPRGQAAADGGEPFGSTPGEFARHLVTELERWRKVVKESGMAIE